jgi:two-component system, NtrC family, nitrogen regulation sensor histidine kinase NtrY
MSLRQKLLLLFSLTVAAAVAAVAWTVLLRIRQVFEQQDQEKTTLLVTQFQRDFQHRSAEVAAEMDRLAASERLRIVARDLTDSADASVYLIEAQSLAAESQLDFLEILGVDGNIISSAQWPARFGYPEPLSHLAGTAAFIKREDLPDSASVLGIFVVRPVRGAPGVKLLGGRRLDQQFLADLPTPAGVEAYLYSAPDAANNINSSFQPSHLLGVNGEVPNASQYRAVIDSAQHSGQPATALLYLTKKREDSVSANVLPLKSETGQVMAVLVVAASRRAMVQAQQHIRAIAYTVAAIGILIIIAISMAIAVRVSRPIEELARAAEEVAQGNWEVRVNVRGRDEVGTLARSFNHMTAELAAQREHLIQSERVAAWRELARRLAHELKNPLFPLQLTVENLVRARALSEAEFDEVFRESTQTLGMEIANLKTIIGRFSDFSRMPKPQLERIDAAAALTRVALLYFPWKAPPVDGCELTSAGEQKIDCCMNLDTDPLPIDADPEMLHRALSNLVLNAMDAMPDGGTLTLSAKESGDQIEIRVADTGQGMTPEECSRLFTPYYTTKQHGTGLGLAIVQSVVADHNATISVESRPGGGTAFVLLFSRAPSLENLSEMNDAK